MRLAKQVEIILNRLGLNRIGLNPVGGAAI
jgi:hypothetical protein